MKLRSLLTDVLAGAALIAIIPATHAAQRTFVSTSGNDLDTCSLTSPCRGFARALTQTDASGEIVVLDSGGYGSVTVDRNVSIVSPPGVYAGITVFPATDGVTVVAPATRVVLRALSINGQGGNNGIRVQAGEVHVENVVISNLTQAGILVEGATSVRVSGTVSRSNADGLRAAPAAGAVSVLVRDSEFSNNTTAGIGVSPSAAGANALVTVERSSAVKNGTGLTAAPAAGASATLIVTQSVTSENGGAGVSGSGSGATVYVRESAVTRNATGLLQAASAVLNACGANLLVANVTAQSGTIGTGSCLDVASGGGTVTSVATGSGLSGGPITTTGTVNLAATNLLPTTACAANQVPKWNGAAWACGNDANSGGTVTSIATAAGLFGGTITGAGTIGISTGGVTAGMLASNGCVNGQILKYNGGAWSCAVDDAGPVNAFVQGGNAFGATATLGTSDNRSLYLQANDVTSLRIAPTTADPANLFDTATANLIGGWDQNAATAGVIGATIGGGGSQLAGNPYPNRVTDHYGTVGGGLGNTAGDAAGTVRDRRYATVGGGQQNTASGVYSTVGGGVGNTASSQDSTVGGGRFNTASGDSSTVGAGSSNIAGGQYSTVGGGRLNTASGDASTVGGGLTNTASGDYSIAGGRGSEARGDYSIAIGRRAKTFVGAGIATGAFAFADSNDFDFASSTDNSFRVRATGGVRFVTEIDGTGATTWSCLATAGNSWACASDRNLKHGLVELDGKAVLAKLAAVPMYQWQPRGKNAHVRHYGPMAQDFYAAFGLGDDDKMIGMQDADGVALSAIQGVNQKLDAQLRAKDDEIAALRSSLAELKRAVDILMVAR